jgi:hypothetical protein
MLRTIPLESAASGGFGYFRIATRYACDDSFELDLGIDRIAKEGPAFFICYWPGPRKGTGPFLLFGGTPFVI